MEQAGFAGVHPFSLRTSPIPGNYPNHERTVGYGSSFLYTHAARQLPNGKWTSKLGKGEDIEHDTPDDVSGGIYGEVVEIMRRPISAGT
jgi:hypothetical protein